jgi:hypothetical protein
LRTPTPADALVRVEIELKVAELIDDEVLNTIELGNGTLRRTAPLAVVMLTDRDTVRELEGSESSTSEIAEDASLPTSRYGVSSDTLSILQHTVVTDVFVASIFATVIVAPTVDLL